MESLSKLDMPKVQFVVDIDQTEEPGPDGLDEVKFLLSATRESSSAQFPVLHRAVSYQE